VLQHLDDEAAERAIAALHRVSAKLLVIECLGRGLRTTTADYGVWNRDLGDYRAMGQAVGWRLVVLSSWASAFGSRPTLTAFTLGAEPGEEGERRTSRRSDL
jgi:hypothetical protein